MRKTQVSDDQLIKELIRERIPPLPIPQKVMDQMIGQLNNASFLKPYDEDEHSNILNLDIFANHELDYMNPQNQ